jgi:hypothetical protein
LDALPAVALIDFPLANIDGFADRNVLLADLFVDNSADRFRDPEGALIGGEHILLPAELRLSQSAFQKLESKLDGHVRLECDLVHSSCLSRFIASRLCRT